DAPARRRPVRDRRRALQHGRLVGVQARDHRARRRRQRDVQHRPLILETTGRSTRPAGLLTMTRTVKTILLLASITAIAFADAYARGDRWTAEQIDELRSLWIGSLEELPADPTNR